MTDLYRLVYTSRNLVAGEEGGQQVAVAGLLAVSKRNNARVGVTGALLFNGGSFAQVLEGSKAAVETTFERIQRDPRHSDVSVLQCEPVAARGFPNWSMGFVGNSPRGRALWTEIARTTNFDLSRLEGNVLFNTLLTIVKEEEGEPTPVSVPGPVTLDVVQLRTELMNQRPGDRVVTRPELARSSVPAPANPDAPALMAQQIEAGVLRTALDDERGRTTALRQELDAAQIALETKTAEVAALRAQADALSQENETLRRHRDVWAERAKALAAVMTREPDFGQEASQQAA